MLIKDLVEQAKELDQHKTDYVAEAKDIQYNGDIGLNMIVPLSLVNGATPLTLSDHALDQACKKLGPPPSKYIAECPPYLAADNLNYWASKSEKTWMVRANEDEARAVLSNVYTPIMNSFVIETAAEFLGDTPHTILRSSYLGPDSMHMKILFASDKHYGEGIYLGNCEIGKRSYRISPFIQKISCENSIIYTAGGIRQRHAYVTVAFLKGLVKESLGSLLNVSFEMLERVVECEVEAIPNVGKSIEEICKLKGLSQVVHDNILMGTRGEETRMGIVNGLSYAAQKIKDVELQHDMESWAGAILVEEGSIFSKLQEVENDQSR